MQLAERQEAPDRVLAKLLKTIKRHALLPDGEAATQLASLWRLQVQAAPAEVGLLLPRGVELETKLVNTANGKLVAVQRDVLPVMPELVLHVPDDPLNLVGRDGSFQGLMGVDVVDDLDPQPQQILLLLELVLHLAHVHEAPGLGDVVSQICKALRASDVELVAQVRAMRRLEAQGAEALLGVGVAIGIKDEAKVGNIEGVELWGEDAGAL
mmetsp:Transcript_129669/g.276635  ORF Transcript_129669/g.276635 Transcript_129669/m.276635 type:complete len:211 (-) Transcript_129669:1099-1731(-)